MNPKKHGLFGLKKPRLKICLKITTGFFGAMNTNLDSVLCSSALWVFFSG